LKKSLPWKELNSSGATSVNNYSRLPRREKKLLPGKAIVQMEEPLKRVKRDCRSSHRQFSGQKGWFEAVGVAEVNATPSSPKNCGRGKYREAV
jgi:hypothetical protein